MNVPTLPMPSYARIADSLQRRAAVWVLALVAAMVSVPFLVPVHRYPLTTFEAEWTAAVLLGAALIAVAVADRAQTRIRFALPAVAAMLLAMGALQYALGMLHYTCALAGLFMFMTAMFCAYLIGRWLVAAQWRDRALQVLSLGLLAGGIASVAVQVAQALDLRAIPDWLVFPIARGVPGARPYANFGQPNLLATYLACAAVAALALARHNLRPGFLVAAIALLHCGLALTASRMGALFALALLALVLTPNPLRPRDGRLGPWTAAAIVGGYAAGVVLTRFFLGGADGTTAVTVFDRYGGSFAQRLSMWSDALRVVTAHPWLGVGVGEYGGAQYLLAHADPSLEATNNPHNLLLQIAAEFGLPVAALIVFVIGAWFRRLLHVSRDDPGVATPLVMIAFILLHAMLEYPLSHLHFLVLTALLVGLAEPAMVHAPGKSLRMRFVAGLVGIAVLLSAVVMKADYDGILPLWASYLDDVRAARPHTPETVTGIIGAMGATFFKPQMERLYVELIPAEAQQGDGNLTLVERVLTRLGDARVIVRYIELLAQAGRSEEAALHAQRLKVFAGPHYAMLRDEILEFLSQGGLSAEPLQAALRAP